MATRVTDAALVSRVSRLRRSRARALLSLNLKKKRDCSQSRGFQEDHVIEKLEVLWNPINTTTFGPWKFGRIYGVGSNYGAKCF